MSQEYKEYWKHESRIVVGQHHGHAFWVFSEHLIKTLLEDEDGKTE